MHCQCDIDVHDFTRLGIGQILSRRPNGLSTRSAFHCGNSRPKATAAKQEATTRTNALHNRQDPAMWIVSGLQSQELSAIHRFKL
jgi:hypothetical protein